MRVFFQNYTGFTSFTPHLPSLLIRFAKAYVKVYPHLISLHAYLFLGFVYLTKPESYPPTEWLPDDGSQDSVRDVISLSRVS